MNKEKAKRILKIYQWARIIGLAMLLMFIYVAAANAQSHAHGGAKESEQDKIVCELMIRF